MHFLIAGTTTRITIQKADRGVERMQADLLEHFTTHGHNDFSEVCTITIIDNINGADPT